MKDQIKSTTPPPETPLLNLVINILLPVLILNKGGHYMNPRYALLLALCLPLGYGIQDYLRRRHKNYISLIGIVNICLTGGLAVMGLHGMWFAVKDASLPLVLGLLTFGSAWTDTPAARLMFCNAQVLNLAAVDERLDARGNQAAFGGLLKRATLWLSLSFFISSVLNFFLAMRIFLEIDASLPTEAQDRILNAQIAKMTWTGFGVIALPLMVFSGVLIYTFLKKLSKLTDLPIDQIMKS